MSASTTWKLSAFAPKPIVQAALLAHDLIDDWDYELVIAGREVAEDRPDDWVLEGWYPRKPGKAEKAALAGLFEGTAPKITVEELPPSTGGLSMTTWSNFVSAKATNSRSRSPLSSSAALGGTGPADRIYRFNPSVACIILSQSSSPAR